MRFNELSLAPELVRTVAELGYETPTPIQQQAIPLALEGKDVLGRAPTGTGKTAAFMLPTLHRMRGKEGLKVLVLCPTRELAIQVADNAREYARGVEMFVGVVYGGVPLDKDMRGLRAGYEIREQARATYLQTEYAGPNDRRPRKGRITKTCARASRCWWPRPGA
jgi:superfamily II DNA/RNA helicase